MINHRAYGINNLSGKNNSDSNTVDGVCNIEPNNFMKIEFKKSIDKAGSVGLHLVHIFHIEPISNELEVKKAYFDTLGDAECYAWEYERDHKDNDNAELASYIIYINCKFKTAHFKDKYANDFMGLKKIDLI